MKNTFIEMKLFQVKPDKLKQFEEMIEKCPRISLNAKAAFLLSISKDFLP